MSRTYTKIEILSAEVFKGKEAGETNRQIAESYRLNKKQLKQLVSRQNRKIRMIEDGYYLFLDQRERRKKIAKLKKRVEIMN